MMQEPQQGSREAVAVHALCSQCSDNFALRLARCVLGGALAWPAFSAPPEPVSDASPGLRNICDGCIEASAGPGRKLHGAYAGSLASGSASASAERMLHWLEAMLAPSAPIEPGSSGKARKT